MSQYFPKPYQPFGGGIKVKVDFSLKIFHMLIFQIYFKNISNFALKTNLDSQKIEVCKLDINKLAPVPVDVSKLSDKSKK